MGRAVAFSDDGYRLACASDDNRVYLWDGTPLTTDEQETREAVSLIRAWHTEGLPKSVIHQQISLDPTVRESLRRRAIEMLQPEQIR